MAYGNRLLRENLAHIFAESRTWVYSGQKTNEELARELEWKDEAQREVFSRLGFKPPRLPKDRLEWLNRKR